MCGVVVVVVMVVALLEMVVVAAVTVCDLLLLLPSSGRSCGCKMHILADMHGLPVVLLTCPSLCCVRICAGARWWQW